MPNPRSQKFIPKFSFKCFSFALSFPPPIHVQLMFVYGMRCRGAASFILLQVDIQLTVETTASAFGMALTLLPRINWPQMHEFIGLFLDFLFQFIDPYVYLYANNTLS